MPQEQADPRTIANDCGQRRIGSGWGIEPVPLDLNEWREKAGNYHTATITSLNITELGFKVTADLTPAYSNSESGKGAFSARTRRVELYTRRFALDLDRNRIDIQDSLKLTKPEFKVSWRFAQHRRTGSFKRRICSRRLPRCEHSRVRYQRNY